MLIVFLAMLTICGNVQGGLFSAVLTAFNVQSYQLLTPPSATDPVIVALERISAQLSSFSVNPPSVNSTHPAFAYHDPAPLPVPRYAVWLNALWFASLICSLSAASIGIMAKQWLNEYSAGLSGNSRQIARLRQLRLNGLRRWHVKEIVAALSVLLQVASALFFAGLLVLLWQLDDVVATVATVLVGLLIIFFLSTIILPSIVPGCAYLSPLSMALYALTPPMRKLAYGFPTILLRCYIVIAALFRSGGTEEVPEEHPRISDIENTLLGMFRVSGLKWHGLELTLLAQESDKLDADSVEAAYTTGMDTNYLHHASVCITELTLATARKCFRAIWSANIAHWGENEEAHTRPMWSVHPCMWSGAVISLMDAASRNSSPGLGSNAQVLKDMCESMSPDNSHVSSALSHTRLVSADIACIIRHYDQDELPSDTMDVAQRICKHHMRRLAIKTSDICLGNDICQQGECTILQLPRYQN